MRYRTEISIPPDRYVCVLLPSYFPEGRAMITITLPEPDPLDSALPGDSDPDRQDIEWWDEFEDDVPTRV